MTTHERRSTTIVTKALTVYTCLGMHKSVISVRQQKELTKAIGSWKTGTNFFFFFEFHLNAFSSP